MNRYQPFRWRMDPLLTKAIVDPLTQGMLPNRP